MTQQPYGGHPQQGYPPQQYQQAPPAPQNMEQAWGAQQQPAQVQAGPSDDSAAFFGGGGPGIPAAKFEHIGATVVGIVLEAVKRQQTDIKTNAPLTFQDGTPRMQLVTTLQTAHRNWENCNKVPTDAAGNPLPPQNDDGRRRIYIRYKMQDAVGRAVAAAGWTGGIVGGLLGVTHTGHDGDAKTYEAKFVPPGQHQGLPPLQQQAPAQGAPQQYQQQYQQQPQQASQPPAQAPQQPQGYPQGQDGFQGFQPSPQQPVAQQPQGPGPNPWAGASSEQPPF